jgi:hypothetical protein
LGFIIKLTTVGQPTVVLILVIIFYFGRYDFDRSYFGCFCSDRFCSGRYGFDFACFCYPNLTPRFHSYFL